MSVIIRSKYILLLAGVSFLTAASALSAERNVKDHLLTDAEIAEKCKVSIAHKLNLVDAEDGGKITQCEKTYLTLRGVAAEYSDTESGVVKEIEASPKSCKDSANQENCLNAGRALAEKAAASHESLAEVAEKGEMALEGIGASGK